MRRRQPTYIWEVFFVMGLKQQQYEQLSLDIGQDLTLNDYTNTLHDTKDGFVTVATKKGKNWAERSHFVDAWQNYIHIDELVDCYASVNSFYKPERAVSNVRHIKTLYSDLDIYNEGLSKDKAFEMIQFAVDKETIPKPTFIIDSGRGLYVMWSIESAPGRFKNVQKLYGHVQDFLYENLEELGADPKAKDMARVLRVPGSTNTKNGARVEVVQYNEECVYTLSYMRDFMNEVNNVDWSEIENEIKERKKKKRTKKKKNSNLARLFNYYTLAIARTEDLKMIVQLRDYDVKGYRNFIIHLYMFEMMKIHKDYYVAAHQTKELNDLFKNSLDTADVNAVCKSSFNAYKEYEKDKTKGYNYKNMTIIERLEMTSEEQKHMKTIITAEEKQRRNTIYNYNKRRDVDGLTAKQREVTERRKRVKELYDKGFNQSEISKKLGVTKMTISRDLKTF